MKETYPKDEVKEKLAEIFMEYPLPYAMDKYTIEDARDDYMKLKGIRYHELIKEGKWFQSNQENLNIHLPMMVNQFISKDIT